MENILVLGSKPDPLVREVDYDAVVFANGAMSKQSIKRFEKSRKIHVVSDYIFSQGELSEAALANIAGIEVDALIVISSVGHDTSLIDAKLEKINYSYDNFLLVPRKEFEERYRVYTFRRFFCKLIFLMFARFDLKEKRQALQKYLNGSIHLSTGFWCLFYSLTEFPLGKIYVSGIDFSSSGYSYLSDNYHRGHFLKDMVALRVLLSDSRNKGRVFFQEHLLSKLQKGIG